MIRTIKKSNKIHIAILVALALYLTNFLDYSKWNPTIGGQLGHFIYLGMIGLVLINRKKIKRLKNPFSFEILVFSVSPFFTYFSQLLIYGESLSVFKLYIYNGIVAIFYLFYTYKVKEQEIIKAVTCIAIAIAVIQIVQQVNPSIAEFGLGDVTKSLEVRNGLLRYRFSAIFYTAMALFFYWEKTLVSKNKLYAVLFLLFTVSNYLYLTRQYLAGIAIAIGFSLFYIKDKSTKRLALLLIVVLVYVIILYSDSLLDYFIESSKNDATDDNIRLYAYQFYWSKTISSITAFLFGNGFPEDLQYWKENFSLYVSDIGIVGQIFTHGIFWAISYVTALYKILWKYRETTPLYIKLFVLSAFVHCSMVASYGGASTLFTWISVLYITSLHIDKNTNERQIDFLSNIKK